jgi:diguanylate cyclase (GGDEF)-like protein
MLSSQYFFQQLRTAVLIVNHKGEVIFSNYSFLKVSGYSNSELSDKKTNELLVDFNLGVNDWQGEVYLKTKENGDQAKWMQVNHVNDPFGHKYKVLMISEIQISGFDPLTMLPNRYLFQHLLQKAINQAREEYKFLGLFYIDLDRFKFINDTLGHGFGDSLLKESARRLKECMGVNDTVARLGGDEFICLIQDVKDEIEAEQRAERIISYFREPFNINETEIYVTSSIGISLFPFDGDEMESLIANADTAMYRAKNAGRNMIEKTEMDIGAGAFENLMIANNLRKALDREEFLLYLQPQFDVKQNRFIAMEALLRWNHPDLGLISPGDFIPIAEETGLIVPIGDWVIKTACLKIKEWLRKGIPPVRIAVNLSAKQFMQNDIVEKIQLVLKETAIPPECLELEITEV